MNARRIVNRGEGRDAAPSSMGDRPRRKKVEQVSENKTRGINSQHVEV